MSPTPAHSVTDRGARYTASTITDDALDALYAELGRLREQQAGFFAQMAAARQQTTRWWQRAQAAERALERARAEGWREAARFLRRTPRDSADFLGALRGARLIEAELRRMADGQQQEAAQ